MKIKVKSLLVFVIYYSIFFRFFVDYFHFPSAARYIIDLIFLLLSICAVNGKRKPNKIQRGIFYFIIIFYLLCVTTYFLNFESLIYLLYGSIFRFRYYLFIVLCCLFLNSDDVDSLTKNLNVIFYINAVVAYYQHFVHGLFGDYLGGIFGNALGCNAYLNMYMITILTISVVKFLHKQEKIQYLLLKILIALSLAALSELKVFFIEFLVLALFALFFTGFSWRKIALTAGVFVGLFVGYFIFSKMYYYADAFLKFDSWIQIATSSGYSAGYNGITGETNRLTFITFMNERFLNSPVKKLLGLGLGNCSFSTLSIFNTPFYDRNSFTRYEWFASAHTYLELGWMGLGMFVGFLVMIYLKAKQLADKNVGREKQSIWCDITQVLSVMAMVLFPYNNSLTLESAFVFYFVLIIPFIKRRNSVECIGESKIIH